MERGLLGRGEPRRLRIPTEQASQRFLPFFVELFVQDALLIVAEVAPLVEERQREVAPGACLRVPEGLAALQVPDASA